MKYVNALVVALLMATPVSAQMSHGETMPIGVEASRVTIGPQWMPRRFDLPNQLIVPASTVMTLPASASYDYIEVQQGGVLRLDRTRDTTVKFTHLVVLPGGYLDRGTVADPIPCKVSVNFIVRDVPIDTSIDPFQWGNGLINFGKYTSVGCAKTDFVEATGSLAPGAVTITLATIPVGWAVGDELLIPDTMVPSGKIYIERAESSRLESTVRIATISGTTVTLSKGLDFAHPNIVDPDGAVVLRPRVANLTRNVVTRSENEKGTAGHTADIGHGATFDVRASAFIGLGRTKAIPLSDTVVVNGAVTKVGTNAAGKYAEHHHHLGSCPSCVDSGNVYLGGGGYAGDVMSGSKAGQVLHDTSDTLAENNIVLFFKGAGFVTEDGYEVRNIIRHNLWAYNTMHLKPGDVLDAHDNVLRGCPFCEQTGGWFRGVMNTFEKNEAWNNGDNGISLLNQDQPVNKYPSKPGGDPDTSLNHYFDKPISFIDNVTAANARTGFEPWGIGKFPYVNLVSAHNVISQVFAVNSVNIFLYLQNPKILCATMTDGTATGYGTHSSMGYVSELTIEQGFIKACATGIAGGGGIGVQGGPGTILNNVTLQNQVNLEMVPRGIDLTDVLFVPLGKYEHRYIQITDVPIWSGVGPLPGPLGGNNFLPARGSKYTIRNFQRQAGKNYKLFHLHAKGSLPAWPSFPFPNQYNPPEEGLTVKQAWLKFGLSYGGDMIDDSEIVPLDGLIDGYAKDGLAYAPGAPKAVVTFPTPRATAILEPEGCPANGQKCTGIKIWAVVTGDQTASPLLCASIDGGGIGASPDPECIDKDQGDGPNDDRSFLTNKITPGDHTVTVWRTQKANPTVKLAGSEFTSKYTVGPITPPPVCVPPQVLVNGSCVTIPPPSCVPPKLLLNGVCVDPPPVCAPPKVIINGVCTLPTIPPPGFTMQPGNYEICSTDVTPRVCFPVKR